MASFGEYIAARRKTLKLTRKDMAAQIKKGDGTHISNTYLLDVEKGQCRPPSDQMIEQIGAILNVPVEVLLLSCGTDAGRSQTGRGTGRTNSCSLSSISARDQGVPWEEEETLVTGDLTH